MVGVDSLPHELSSAAQQPHDSATVSAVSALMGCRFIHPPEVRFAVIDSEETTVGMPGRRPVDNRS
jgi:hypothetical protein